MTRQLCVSIPQSILRRVVATVFLTLAAVPLSAAHAEERAVIAIPAASFSGLAGPGRQERSGASAMPQFSLTLPGDSTAGDLSLGAGKPVLVPLIGQQGESRGDFHAALYEVTGDRHRTGFIVVPSNGSTPPVELYATLLDWSVPGELTFFQIVPLAAQSADGASLHEVVRMSGAELKQLIGLGDDDRIPIGQREGQSTGPGLSSSAAALGDGKMWHEIEVVVDGPVDFSEGRSEEAAAAQILSSVSAANIYFRPLELELKLTGIRVFSEKYGPDPYADAESRRDARGMLETVRSQWADRGQPAHDIAAVFGASRFGNYVGLAYPATSCLAPEYACLFATQGGDSAQRILGLSATLAHEIGHIIGMDHDGSTQALMSPYYVINPTGFSDVSIAQYQAYAAQGGTGCFSEIPAPEEPPGTGGVLSFPGGNNQTGTVYEGQTFVRSFAVAGAAGDVYYRALGLPEGASIDARTGLFVYTPGADTADTQSPAVQFSVTMQAFSGAGTISADLQLTVFDLNQLPELIVWGPEAIIAEEGSRVELYVEAQDPDAGDTARISVVNRKDVRRFPGSPRLAVSGNALSFAWDVRAGSRGVYALKLQSADLRGGSTAKTIPIAVVSRNAAPVITAPEEVVVSGGTPLVVEVSGADAEGTALAFDFTGLPAGALLRYDQNNVRLEYTSAAAEGEQLSLVASAWDGAKVSRRTIKARITGPGQAASAGVTWPGNPSTAGQSGSSEGIDLYNTRSGVWQKFDCRGQVLAQQQFGGFIGDLPVHYVKNRKSVEAVYRLIHGQGYWYIDGGARPQVIPWGLQTDVPVTGDFDGDGTSDLAMYAPLKGEWNIRFSRISPQVLADTVFGADTAQLRFPFAADVDGDGLSDRVIFSRKTDGAAVFDVWLASGQHLALAASRPAFSAPVVPLSGDFDGDGRVDVGTYSPDGGMSLFLSATGRVMRTGASAAAADLLGTARCGEDGREDLVLLNPDRKTIRRLRADSALGTLAEESLDLAPQAEVTGGALTVRTAALRRNYTLNTIPADPDGDGHSNMTVWRTSNRGLTGRFIEQTRVFSAGFYPPVSGAGGYPLSGAFFGKGRSELAYFVDGDWFIQDEQGVTTARRWGQVGDVPVPGDYNGDGRTDLAVFRPSASVWWILIDNPGGEPAYKVYPWGEDGDVPVPADYDGDGVDDLAVYRPKTGQWYVLSADGRVKVVLLGAEGDVPLPADFNADGQAEPAVWRPGNGTWYIRLSGETPQILAYPWGLSSDRPVLGDFNGDARADLTVWRPAEGTWYVKGMDSLFPNISAVQFGLPGDIPLGSPACLGRTC